MTRQRKPKVQLPPKFEIVQLIALQLGIGLAIMFYLLKTEEAKEIFKNIPKVLEIVKIINSLCAFCCIVLSGGKLLTYYNEIKSFIEYKKRENEK